MDCISPSSIRTLKPPTVAHCRYLVMLTALALFVGVAGYSAELASTNRTRRVSFREPQATAYLITSTNTGVESPTRMTLSRPEDSWTPAALEGVPGVEVQLGSRVVLQLEASAKIQDFLDRTELKLSRSLARNVYILQAPNSATAIDAAETLATQPGVVAAYPVMRRSWKKRTPYASVPNDPLFKHQWHLENRDANHSLAGVDLNVRAAWPITQGEGVVVAVADDGFQLEHPDLANRAVNDSHYNFYRNNTNAGPSSSTSDHATAVAGLIAAELNNQRGVSGVAPAAGLASWVIFGLSRVGFDDIASDEQLMDMFQYASNRVAVQNHSWGNAGTAVLGPDSLIDIGLSNAVARGRGGKGVVMVRAAGNEREDLTNANDDGFASDPRAIAVAAVRQDGRACSYSSPGACLLVGAPSGDAIDTDNDGLEDEVDPLAPNVLTTDRTGADGYNTDSGESGDYGDFNGTSASSPQVAGVAALILAANPNLSYRDVQQILLQSARHYDLADPDARLNGAGLRVSHNVGYGVPDAGLAVQLARRWKPRPTAVRTNLVHTETISIPDDALRVICAGPGLPASLASIRCLPSLGPHADDPTPALPVVYVGQANEDLTTDLKGKVALIQRGTSYFVDKINRAAQAGATAAIIFNNTGTNEIQAMGGTTFVPIPAVAIGKTDGDTLRDFLGSHPTTTAQVKLTSAVVRFAVPSTWICEHVGVRLQTTHPRRSDVRVTLVSPMGTRSVLEAINGDTSSGPNDWTFWSTQHFYEGTAGEWRLEVSDERYTILRSSRGSTRPATGSLTEAELILEGVPILDADHDGLDDSWEMKHWGSLAMGPRDDPDGDGFNNAREQAIGSDPTASDAPFQVDVTEVEKGFWRFSWPAQEGSSYRLETVTTLGSAWTSLGDVTSRGFTAERVVVAPSGPMQIYRVSRQASTSSNP